MDYKMYWRSSFIIITAYLFSPHFGNTQELSPPAGIAPETTFLEPAEIAVNGLLGEAIISSRNGRIAFLPSWNNGELIAMFGKEVKDKHDKTDWYGEHGGKWLYTASLAAANSQNEELEMLLTRTADFFVKAQDPDGYLGTYSPSVRLTNDKAAHKRSWDVWNLSYMTLGMLQLNRYHPDGRYLNSAKQIGALFLRTFGDGRNDVTDYGTRRGISATVILDPLVELYKETHDVRYLNLAETIVDQMEEKEDLKLINAGKNSVDMEHVGDGKIYQIIWTLTGVVKLYEVTGNEEYLHAATNIWQNITGHHLNITGGPWGGVGKHMECFNRKNFWSPYGLVETCSTMSWIQLNKEMLKLTGEAKYAQEIEKSAYNSLLGARFPNGIDWSYHSFNNGSWHIANFNDCCPSSGALALEELPSLIYSRRENGIALNVFSDSEANLTLGKSNRVRITQRTRYPFDGKILLTITPSRKESFPVYIRIPEWTNSATVKVNGKAVDTQGMRKGKYFVVSQPWNAGDNIVEIGFPFELRLVQQSERVNAPQNAGQIYQVNWFSLSRGPLVFAVNGLIDGKDRERALTVDLENPDAVVTPASPPDGVQGPAYELKFPGTQPLLFVPYYEAGGRKKGEWRLTWLQAEIR